MREPSLVPGLASASALISVEALRKTFGSNEALAGIQFDLKPGELLGLLGPNGAGKTTTLKVLSGLLYPTAGSVAVLGHDP